MPLATHKVFNISVLNGSEDYDLFSGIINQGIDAHLEAFTKSTFEVKGQRHGCRLYMAFDESELPILLRRLRELGTDEADQWADDIENYEPEEG